MGIRGNFNLDLHFEDIDDPVSRFELFGPSEKNAEPEQKLMLAALNDAFQIICKNLHADSKLSKALFREAQVWFEDNDDSYFFSCKSICENLGLEYSYVRNGIRRYIDLYRKVKDVEKKHVLYNRVEGRRKKQHF